MTADAPRTRSFGIIGAGCAGLSLAVELLEAMPDARVTVVEPRTSFPRDRTWCWWSVEPTRWDHLATHTWHRWRARTPRTEIVHEARRHPYRHLPSDRFHVAAIDHLRATGRAELRLGLEARDVTVRARAAWIETPLESAGPFEIVFDGRPPHLQPGLETEADRAAGLVQRFVGREVRTDRPVFDPTTVELMDFDVPQAGGPHFVYVLPFAEDHALVESTRLMPPGAPEPDWDAAIAGWLERRGASAQAVLREERGAIPMRSIPVPRGPVGRHCPIGTAAGLVKPSSGYAFAAVQRASRRLARAVATERVPQFPAVRSRLAESMDRLMLSLLRSSPEVAPDVLVGVLRGVRGDRAARFLTDHARPSDLLAVLRATPPGPMTRHLLGRSPASRPTPRAAEAEVAR